MATSMPTPQSSRDSKRKTRTASSMRKKHHTVPVKTEGAEDGGQLIHMNCIPRPAPVKQELSDSDDAQDANEEDATPDDTAKLSTIILRLEQLEQELQAYQRVGRDLGVYIVRCDGDDIEYYCATTDDLRQEIHKLCCSIASMEREYKSLEQIREGHIRRIGYLQYRGMDLETRHNSAVLENNRIMEGIMHIGRQINELTGGQQSEA
ncbi:hypothetical protein GGR57DRAFT_504692 [Xylariaceae sp. FL1272]|nr:hypothetical protein GGR57DRAFT_504692 [Xylariaceae sp. FL1272]